jgi:hypothetical protein
MAEKGTMEPSVKARVTGLIPMAFVANVQRSVDFYKPLGMELRGSKISLAAWRMFDRLSRASEYGRVVSPGNGSR